MFVLQVLPLSLGRAFHLPSSIDAYFKRNPKVIVHLVSTELTHQTEGTVVQKSLQKHLP